METARSRFLRYVTYYTTSDEHTGTSPSTERQKDLGRVLLAELTAQNAFITCSDGVYRYHNLLRFCAREKFARLPEAEKREELNRLGREMGVKDELLVMLEHMVLSHHDLPEYGSPKPPMFPEAEVLHCLDLIDARIFEMNRALASVQPGSFTERIWALDRKLYRRTDK